MALLSCRMRRGASTIICLGIEVCPMLPQDLQAVSMPSKSCTMQGRDALRILGLHCGLAKCPQHASIATVGCV